MQHSAHPSYASMNMLIAECTCLHAAPSARASATLSTQPSITTNTSVVGLTGPPGTGTDRRCPVTLRGPACLERNALRVLVTRKDGSAQPSKCGPLLAAVGPLQTAGPKPDVAVELGHAEELPNTGMEGGRMVGMARLSPVMLLGSGHPCGCSAEASAPAPPWPHDTGAAAATGTGLVCGCPSARSRDALCGAAGEAES